MKRLPELIATVAFVTCTMLSVEGTPMELEVEKLTIGEEPVAMAETIEERDYEVLFQEMHLTNRVLTDWPDKETWSGWGFPEGLADLCYGYDGLERRGFVRLGKMTETITHSDDNLETQMLKVLKKAGYEIVSEDDYSIATLEGDDYTRTIEWYPDSVQGEGKNYCILITWK